MSMRANGTVIANKLVASGIIDKLPHLSSGVYLAAAILAVLLAFGAFAVKMPGWGVVAIVAAILLGGIAGIIHRAEQLGVYH